MAAMVARYFVNCFDNNVLLVLSVFERTQAFNIAMLNAKKNNCSIIVKFGVDHRILKESKGIRLIKDLL